MNEYVDNCLAENACLRRKLQSKGEALLILSRELDQCRTERDQYKMIAEQIQIRSSTLRKKPGDLDEEGTTEQSLYSDHFSIPATCNSLQLLAEANEQNKSLRLELQDLKQKLRDAYGDIKVLRAGLTEAVRGNGGREVLPAHQKEELVEQLETLAAKYTQLQSDLQVLLDEKEELITERDAYKCKVHRLNHELNALLKGDTNKVIDIDALIMDNKYLQERLEQVQEEKELSHQALLKYKSVLEKKRNKGHVRLGSSSTGMVVTHKQVQELLEKGTAAQLPNTEATLADLKSLCLALVEALQDKSLALSHQKKANRILAERISELEQRLETAEGMCVPAFPSQILLQGYSSALVDKDVERILGSDDARSIHVSKNEENDIQRNKENENTTASSENQATKTADVCEEGNSKCLPSDLEELVHQALQQIKEDCLHP